MTLRQALAQERDMSVPDGRFNGRGIVICAGGPRYFTCAWVLISLLRRVFFVDLPVQVWHLGQMEMSEEMRLLLEELDIEVIDAESVIARYPARITGGWPLKPYAIAQSRFREVLYLDADTVPLIDPCCVFDWAEYRDSGLLLWPDAIDLNSSNSIWRATGLEPRTCASIDTSAILVDKNRAWPVLKLAVLLNEHVEEVYHAIYGDKDTFLIAALLARYEPAIIPHRPMASGYSDLIQRDPSGEPFIHHRTGTKWNLTESNLPLPQSDLMSSCEQALGELRQRWNGIVFHPPQRTQWARDAEKHLIAGRRHLYETWTTKMRTLELLPGGRVQEGRGPFEQHWAVIERDGELILQFYSTSRLSVELTRSEDGSWQGQSLLANPLAARLIESGQRQSWPHQDADRIVRSAADWVDALLDPTLFGAGFDSEKAAQLRGALSLLNDRFDDVPEQLRARLTKSPEPWRGALADIVGSLAEQRDKRLLLSAPSAYSRDFTMQGYDRVP